MNIENAIKQLEKETYSSEEYEKGEEDALTILNNFSNTNTYSYKDHLQISQNTKDQLSEILSEFDIDKSRIDDVNIVNCSKNELKKYLNSTMKEYIIQNPPIERLESLLYTLDGIENDIGSYISTIRKIFIVEGNMQEILIHEIGHDIDYMASKEGAHNELISSLFEEYFLQKKNGLYTLNDEYCSFSIYNIPIFLDTMQNAEKSKTKYGGVRFQDIRYGCDIESHFIDRCMLHCLLIQENFNYKKIFQEIIRKPYFETFDDAQRIINDNNLGFIDFFKYLRED